MPTIETFYLQDFGGGGEITGMEKVRGDNIDMEAIQGKWEQLGWGQGV